MMKNIALQLTKKQHGVTLIELMIALVISLVLMLGVGSVYFNSKRTYLVQEEFARLQEGARVAVKFMIQDIRMAGYVGCAWNNNLEYEDFLNQSGTDPQNNEATGNFSVGITAFDAESTAGNPSGPNTTVDLANLAGAWHNPLPTFITASSRPPIQGSDIIIVRYATGNGAELSKNKSSNNLWIKAGGTGVDKSETPWCHPSSGICDGDILLVTDCKKSRLFQATSGMSDDGTSVKLNHGMGSDPGNAKTSWGGASEKYHDFEAEDSKLFRAASYAYYIAENANNEPSLYRLEMRTNAVPQELIEGVENLQILYGIDTDKTLPTDKGDGIPNRYVSANTNTGIFDPANDNTVSVRFSLLLRTRNEIATKDPTAAESKDYILTAMTAANGTTVSTVPDRRLRKVFTSTVKIRNKGLQ